MTFQPDDDGPIQVIDRPVVPRREDSILFGTAKKSYFKTVKLKYDN